MVLSIFITYKDFLGIRSLGFGFFVKIFSFTESRTPNYEVPYGL